MAVEIYIVDDDEALAKMLGHLFKSVGLSSQYFASAENFLDAIDPHVHGVALIDLRMSGMDGLQCQSELQTRGIHIPVIFLTGFAEVEVAVNAMHAGAFDFVEKPFNDQLLLETVQNAVKHVEDTRALVELKQQIRQRLESLTEREHEILRLVVDGHSSNTIGSKLSISAKTVAVHRANMMHKMQAETVAELVKMIHIFEFSSDKANIAPK